MVVVLFFSLTWRAAPVQRTVLLAGSIKIIRIP
ncbi:hypothetical protein Pan153_50030 [Gimesia panareensis]|uniref:Uncharacterized protein n=1 Tax=Gimesia panareensis TaxID=2527978 RepID=A0A518FVG9_9PLAN|nr:hypothetical protein Pan153_50030 [Gimesia panareensis]